MLINVTFMPSSWYISLTQLIQIVKINMLINVSAYPIIQQILQIALDSAPKPLGGKYIVEHHHY